MLPATIDNNIPNSEMSVGADTALNHVVSSIDRIRETSAATRRCFVVETMGGYCGYLALMSGLSGGAVRVYRGAGRPGAPQADRPVVDAPASHGGHAGGTDGGGHGRLTGDGITRARP